MNASTCASSNCDAVATSLANQLLWTVQYHADLMEIGRRLATHAARKEGFSSHEVTVPKAIEEAPHFFHMVRSVLLDQTILSLTRLLEPYDGKNHKNMSLEAGIEMCNLPDEKRQELRDRLEQVRQAHKTIRTVRNKLIAHGDFNLVANYPASLPKDWEKLPIDEILREVVGIACAIDGIKTKYDEGWKAGIKNWKGLEELWKLEVDPQRR